MKAAPRYVMALAAVAAALLLFRLPGGTPSAQPQPMPLVLRQVQALGDLHTARYTYQHVFEMRSHREAQEWAQVVRPVASLVEASTANAALVSATAEVEAGVDLGRARMEKDTLVLPRAAVYRPQVEAQMHQVRAGLFWRDDNLALKAVATMEQRVRQAAQEQGIRSEAERNALMRVQTLLRQSGSLATVRFE